MAKYRKRPVVVEATQWRGATFENVPGVHPATRSEKAYVITIHGQKAYLEYGDWVITEMDGLHYYPCKPDIFDATYEPAE